MRKSLTLLLLMVCIETIAQSYPITGINISLPASPDANTANWGSGTSLFTITASAKLDNGRMDYRVPDSKILVTIKSGGSKICGAYTVNTAPSANFNTVVKIWNGNNATALLGKDCVLPTGDYELCVQFFGYSLAAQAPVSEEKCKTFTIKGNDQQTYQPPQLLMPENGKLFTEIEIKQPITLRWTPVVPKPQEPVTYRLSIWQLMQGQTGAQAMKANTPVVTKDVDNITQTVVTNLVTGPCKPPYLCEFVWNVQAVSKDGKPIGTNQGTSGTNQFTVNSSSCSHTADIASIECLGYVGTIPQYKVCVVYKNIATAGCSNCTILLNSANNYPGVGGGGVTIVSTSPSTVINTILPGVPVNLTAGQQATICFNVTVTPGNSLRFQVHGTCNDASISLPETDRNHENSIFDTLPKPCICNPCKDKLTVFGNAASSTITYQNSGLVNVSSTVTHTPVKVLKVSAEIVDVERLGEVGCLRCTKESREFGNFISGSLNANTGTIVNGKNGYGKQIQWMSGSPFLVNNFSYDLQMMFPPLTEVSCCKDSIRVCTRWSFTDEKCVTCDTLICSVVTREYKKQTGPILMSPRVTYASEIAKMGEPYNSWYQQESDELPKDFNKQIEGLLKINSEDIKRQNPRELENGMKETFLSIRNLKSLSVSGLWNTIQANPLNDMCNGGNFEDSIFNVTEWSGGYGTIPTNGNTTWVGSNPILGSYTSGIVPAPGIINEPICNAAILSCPTCPASGTVTAHATEPHQSIVRYGDDPTLPVGLLKTTSSSTNHYSLRIGNPCMYYGTEYISKKFVVGGNGEINFMYALLLEGGENTSFWVKVFDNTGTPINNVVYLDQATPSTPKDHIVSSATDPFFQHYTPPSVGTYGIINYKDWTCATIKLDSLIGQTVTVAIITTDCSLGGHWGYAYIDDWCGNCNGSTNGSVNIVPNATPCIKPGTQICVDYTLPKIGSVTGSGTIKLKFYQNGSPVSYSLTSTPLTASGTYCFTIDPSQLPCTLALDGSQPGYDMVATGNFSITPSGGSAIPLTVTSPGIIGNFQGITAGFNNDLVCCGPPPDICCGGFVKQVTAVVSMVGNPTAGYNTVQFKPTFIAGPKPIKQIRISVINFESSSSNKECLTCEASPSRYGTMSVPQNFMGGGKDAIEGMVYPTAPIVATCLGCPPGWRSLPSSEVTWGSESGPGYDLTAGSGGDQTTTFSVSLPKRSTLSCCDDTIKICIKYSFTDVDCKTCDTIICYKVVNRMAISTVTGANGFSKTGYKNDYFTARIVPGNKSKSYENIYALESKIFSLQTVSGFHSKQFSNFRGQLKKEEPLSHANEKKRPQRNFS
jgi:hypothetical protein